MNLTVLGSSASAPGLANPGSGFLVESDTARIWMDCGPGTFGALAERMDPADVDAVVLSHIHPDHSVDLIALYSYLVWGAGSGRSVRVLAPEGAKERIAAFVGAEAPGHALFRALAFETVGAGSQAVVGEFGLRFGSAVHSVPAVVTRIDHGSTSLTYSGDTGPGGDLIEIAGLTDLLLCEASLQGVRSDDTYPHHLTAREAGGIASTAGAGALVLTHIPVQLDPQLSIDQASSAFVGSISYATPGATFSTNS